MSDYYSLFIISHYISYGVDASNFTRVAWFQSLRYHVIMMSEDKIQAL